jgi:dihydropteroate synthase
MRTWNCGRFQLPIGQRTLVMGILNATPDSFSGDGVLGKQALDRALQMIEDGADILDIGGESTRPGAVAVSAEEEIRRLLPLVEALSAQTNTPLSVDTSKAEVARRMLDAGATIINDISAGTFDSAMLPLLGTRECGIVLMHLRGTPENMAGNVQQNTTGDVIAEVLAFWQRRIEAARAAGVTDDRLCLDAGFGFGKSVEENLELVRRGQELSDLGFPILSALSRKSTLGKVLGDAPVEERLFGTAAATALAIHNGAHIIRVHDVKEMVQVARVADAIIGRG